MKNILIKAENIIPLSESNAAYLPLSLNVTESSVISIIGPELSVKTQWLKTLNGLNAMARGELTLLDHNVRQLDRQTWLGLQKEISYVGQDTALLSAYTLMENIMLPALYHKLASRNEISLQVHALLDEIGFKDMEIFSQLPAYVSPLQNYYARIVRALIVKPKLLFLDDLYAYLSPDKALSLKKFLMHKVEKTGVSIVLTTSNIKQVIDDSTMIVFVSPDAIGSYTGKKNILSAGDSPVKKYLSRFDVH
jgi:phospholipid/cholesterol/gamma-HCH transport system ATP-binding protein